MRQRRGPIETVSEPAGKPAEMPPDVISWRAHPFVQEPWAKGVGLVILILGFAIALTLTFASLLWGFLAITLLVGSTSRYLFPTVYQINSRSFSEVHLGRRREAEWSRVRRVVDHGDGIFLGVSPTPSRLDTFQGWFLRYPPDPPTRMRISRAVRDKTTENR